MSESNVSGTRQMISQALQGASVAFLLIYGGFLVVLILQAGRPDNRLLVQHQSDIPALTEMSMEQPIWIWPVVYSVCCLVCLAGLLRFRLGWKMSMLTTFIASGATFYLYAGYVGLVVLPGMKLMLRYTN